MTDVSPAVEAPRPAQPSNPFSRIIGVLLSPIRTFESIARKPDWVVPAILIIVVFLVAAIVTVPRVDFETMSRQAMEAQGRSGPQVEQALRFTVAIGKGIQYTVPL